MSLASVIPPAPLGSLPSAAALFPLFALCVQRVPACPSVRFSERVSAAVPRFASWLVGSYGCRWFAAWDAAASCAALVGVSVGSGGVSLGGVQLSLFS